MSRRVCSTELWDGTFRFDTFGMKVSYTFGMTFWSGYVLSGTFSFDTVGIKKRFVQKYDTIGMKILL